MKKLSSQNHPRFRFCMIACMALLSSCGGGRDGVVEETSVPKLAQTPTALRSGMALGTEHWNKSSQGASGPVAGVECLKNENYHIHAHLSIYVNGERLAIPKNIGLAGCALELHTHDESGIIHVETDRFREFTLGQFFNVWGQPFWNGNVAGFQKLSAKVYIVDEGHLAEVTGLYTDIKLLGHRSINIVLGSPPPEIARYAWPADL